MKRLNILLLFCFLLSSTFLPISSKNGESLGQDIKKGITHSKDFILSKEMGNFLLFALSTGFLIYLPEHLSKYSIINRSHKSTIDKIIRYPHDNLCGNSYWSSHFYYEIATLLAGYVCIKTGQPYWEKLKKPKFNLA